MFLCVPTSVLSFDGQINNKKNALTVQIVEIIKPTLSATLVDYVKLNHCIIFLRQSLPREGGKM